MSDSIFGELQVAGTDTAWPPVKFDRLALDGGERLLFASVLADSGIIKGIRALLHTEKRVTISATGVKVKKASGNEYSGRKPNSVGRIDGGYTSLIHRLEFGQAHAFYMTRLPGFMPALTDEHLWAALNQTTYTTPLLPAWVGYIKGQLLGRDLLREALCYRCDCAVLTATTADLDLIVTEGLESGRISIPRRASA